MKVLVLNGSPSGERGVTAQYVAYLVRRFPEHQFHSREVARSIIGIERDKERWDGIAKELREADVVLWAFPVYLMLVPAQLKRFIELVFDRLGKEALRGKLTSSLTTSAHHYDHTAHDYMEAVCADLGMTYMHGFSAGSEDLLKEAGRKNLVGWAKELFCCLAGEQPLDAACPPWSGLRRVSIRPCRRLPRRRAKRR